MDKLFIIKIGGNIIDHPGKLEKFLKDFSSIKERKILVHGGGRLATELADKLGIPQQMVDGRRITDAETLRITTMVYAGWINKSIVARLQRLQCNAFGMSGADGRMVEANKRPAGAIDFGYVGDITGIHANLLQSFLERELVPVFAPLSIDPEGVLLNTNADSFASAIAQAMSQYFTTELIFCFEKPGVLSDPKDESSVIKMLDPGNYAVLKEKGSIFAGMIPKLDNAFEALNLGVSRVRIGHAEDIQELLKATKGTSICHD